jgi:hypothetical protein
MAWAVLTRAPEGRVVRRPIHSSSVEQFAQKALAATVLAPLVTVLPAMVAIAAIVEHPDTTDARRTRLVVAGAALDDLVEFATIEPNAATLWAIVDLNALSLAHDEISSAGGTKKPLFLDIVRHCGYLIVTCRLFRLEAPVGAWVSVSIGRSLLDRRR